ncbi:MAG: molybdopterin-binding protein [Dehalococcoidales bacterium]|nr:molybdopterin-binding protein [Dehalococcoidales bacterium]
MRSISYNKARSIAAVNISLLTRVESVAIDEASGRVLAETVVAGLNVPSFDRAAMDGYAVRAKDTLDSTRQNPKILKLVGELHAGDTPKTPVKAGECLQVATGAVMPRGSDAVVQVEDIEVNNGVVKVFKPVSAGANISPQGEDIKEGDIILKADAILNAGKIGALAALGLTKCRVYAKPVVAILSSGEEVAAPGKKLRPGNIYDVNSHTIASVVSGSGGIPLISGIVGDNLEDIKARIGEALKSDLVVISGGSSVGKKDLLVDALDNWGEVLFHGIKVKPGAPILFALVQGKPLFGMPGPPASCLIQSLLFLGPAVRKMARLPPQPSRTVAAKLECRVSGIVGRRQFLPVIIKGNEAVPVFKKSGTITSVAGADGYIEIPEDVAMWDKGETVSVTLF